MHVRTLISAIAAAAIASSLTSADLSAQMSQTLSDARSSIAEIALNDNTSPAGTLKDGVLTISLEARDGVWRPRGANGSAIPVAAWAEMGKVAQNPGPLIRVPIGTQVRATVRNALDKPLIVYGLGAKRGVAADSFIVQPGAVHETRFTANVAGTFYYVGKTDTASVFERFEHDTQLNGFLVVDPPGARVADRLFLISWWGTLDSTTATGFKDGLIVINGRDWPHTERLTMMQGDTAHWRWANVTAAPHPMHLHGFYFRLDGRGDGASERMFEGDERRLAVTEAMFAGQTMRISWAPTKPGNWIFHCHFAGHMTSLLALNDMYAERSDDGAGKPELHEHAMDHMSMMSGLVLGIVVQPRGEVARSTRAERPMQLIIRSTPKAHGRFAGYGYALGDTPQAADGAPLSVPGPTLVLRKDEPVAITIVNRTHEGAAVHWHGIELESFPDGVPGWSGSGDKTLPTIPPGDSLTVRFTPPRAGTFMYHSHFNEFMQIGSGLFGPIVVLEPGETFDPKTDRVLVFSDANPFVKIIGPTPKAALNGKAQPDTIRLAAGVKHRLRLINIRTDFAVVMKLTDGDKPVMWRAIAKDGAMLPASQATVRPAVLPFLAGEIYDFEYTPEKPGTLELSFNDGFPPDAPWTKVVVRVQ